jgi:hypothetical protein
MSKSEKQCAIAVCVIVLVVISIGALSRDTPKEPIAISGPYEHGVYLDKQKHEYVIGEGHVDYPPDYNWPVSTQDGDIWSYRGLYFFKGFDGKIVATGTSIEDAAKALAQTRRAKPDYKRFEDIPLDEPVGEWIQKHWGSTPEPGAWKIIPETNPGDGISIYDLQIGAQNSVAEDIWIDAEHSCTEGNP